MNLRWYTRALLAAGSGAALALSFPKHNLWPLAWVALAMLILASYRSRPAVSPIYGFLHGLVFYPVGLPWIAVVMEQYGSINPWTSAGVLSLMGIAGGIICSFFSLGVALASKKSRVLPFILAPFLWVTLEYARTHLPYIGFPWNLTGYAASGNIALVQLTSITGIWGLSFLIAAYGALLAYAVVVGRQRVWKAFLVTTASLGLIALVGGYFVPHATPTHYAHLIQTELAVSEEQPANWMQLHARDLDQLENISVGSVQASQIPKNINTPQAHDRLIVWPEEPAPFTMQDPAFVQRAQRIARESNSDFLVGVVEWNLNAQSHQQYATNSAVMLDPEGQQIFRYDKRHLVPFSEYVPLRNLLTFAKPLVQGIGDFTPGTKYSVGELPGGKFGVFICYEAIFPNEVRRYAKEGAQLLINVSDDGWFGRSSAPLQHVMMARVRAVENRRWLLRDTNNGFTVAFDPYGRIVASMPADERGELDAPYAFRSDITPYVRFGDWLPWLCILASIGVLVYAFAQKQKIESRERETEKRTAQIPARR
jgi:apolipoprotein N-acyltransferase